MGKILYLLCFILSVFPTDANENRRHIHVTRRGSKKAHIGDTVAKIWIEKNGTLRLRGLNCHLTRKPTLSRSLRTIMTTSTTVMTVLSTERRSILYGINKKQ